MSRRTVSAGGIVGPQPASFEASMLIRLPLSLFTATLVMACTPQGKPAAVADKTPVSAPTAAPDKAAICRAKCMAAVDAPKPVARPGAEPARPRVHRVYHEPRVIKGGGRVAGGYVSEGSGGGAYGGAYGGRYAGSSVSVTETGSSSASYRYSESEERWGSRGATYASGSSGGYAYGSASGASGRESRYGPPPATVGAPASHPHGPSVQLAGITRDGALTWPGKVAY
jgi:hypothetical protein